MNSAVKYMYKGFLGGSFLCGHSVSFSYGPQNLELRYEFVDEYSTRTTVDYANYRWSWRQELGLRFSPIYTISGRKEWM